MKLLKVLLFSIFFSLILNFFILNGFNHFIVKAQQNNNSQITFDFNNDNQLNILDIIELIKKIFDSSYQFANTNENGDVNNDSNLNLLDIISLISAIFDIAPSPTATPTITPTTNPGTGEWSQFGGNAQNTSFTTEYVATPWKYKWQWNGADANGKTQAGHLPVPKLVQPITGGNRVYIIGGNSVYAIDKNSGSVVWSKGSFGTLSSTPIYDNENLYVASGNNSLYKLNAANGNTLNTFTADSAINLAPMIANNYIFAVTANGTLYKLDKATLSKIWQYSGSSPAATPPAYSSNKNTITFVTQDLFVHTVNNSNGSLKWRVKPTGRTYQSTTPNSSGAQAENGWPVIAEGHNLVFIRYRLDWDTLWTWNPFPLTNAQIKSNLASNQNVLALFPLNLDNGAIAFTPAVGNGGAGDGGTLPMGPMPVIRVIDGNEVAYIIWRNGLTSGGCTAAGSCCDGTIVTSCSVCASSKKCEWSDGREDATMGEMVLDNDTVVGYTAGDVRFVKFTDIQTDEMMNITMSNDTIFHSHWLINAAEKVTDRSASLGATFKNPIKTISAPYVIWRQCNQTNTCNYPGCTGNTYCGINCAPSSSRYCSQGLYSYGDARSYPAGFYEYNNDMNSGTTPFTVVSSGLVLIKTNDGAIIALESGSPTANASVNSDLTASSQTVEKTVLGADSYKPTINWEEASNYFGKYVETEGVIASAVDHRPKAVYLGFKNPHDGGLLIRIFEKDLSKFNYNLLTLKNKKIKVTGLVTYYWPDNIDPEIIVTDPSQIQILD